MFIRIQVSARRKEHLSANDPQAIVSWERDYPDDLVGEMSASLDGQKAVDSAISKLHAQEAQRRANRD